MSPPKLTRRSLLKTGLIGAALVSVSSAALLLQPEKQRSAHSTLKVLSEREANVLSALASRLCPAMGPGAPGAEGVQLVEQIDAFLATADKEGQDGLKMALVIFDNAFTGALFGERVRPFSQLDGAAQDRVIHAWQKSSVGFRRTVMRALSATIMTFYWGDERTWQRIGYGGPPDAVGMRAAYAHNLVDYSTLVAMAPKET